VLELASYAIAAGHFCKKRLARFRFKSIVALAVYEFLSSMSKLTFHSVATKIVELELFAKLGLVLSRICKLKQNLFILWAFLWTA
jgi:hypothetical protein